MENAAKALLIAAGVLIGLILISMIIISSRQISSYYKAKEEEKVVEQLADFNEQFSVYNRDDIRGTELISLINKIIDYNRQNEERPIAISIRIPGSDNVNAQNFYYNYSRNSSTRLITLGKTYNASNFKTEILDIAVNQIEKDYPRGLANELANNLYKIVEADSDTKKIYLKTLNLKESDVNKSDILKYYQYVQLKRAHFDCTTFRYGQDGRVEHMSFEFNQKFE